MKTTFKPKAISNRNSLPSPRPWHRNSAYAFVACLGIWLPRGYGAILVNLDATQLPTGPLNTWTNTGTVVGNFTSPATAIPNITIPSVPAGAKGVTLNPTGTAQYYTGPTAPPEVTGPSSRSIEAWVYNPAAADE